VLTVVNPHVREERSAAINLRGASARRCLVETFAASDIRTHNTFDNPHAAQPEKSTATLRDKIVWTFKPASVTKLEFDLG
jgi:alpha-L-arabinofuranosidase